ncbi:unnamed protein product [Phytophthora lilii]|uniref:Unnamed protein product n=1 Tax=Phytophthora lilii TaxID=2077276 RepID=A0A9W6U9Y9_9STRA|nr:unnamed protein product [Phytophthora lilii]
MASPMNKTIPPLHLTIRSRYNELKQKCHEVCGDTDPGKARKVSKTGTTTVQPVHDFFSSVQLWKERSLHHTLEALDKAGVPFVDSHVEAMEDHEKAAKDLFELTRVFLDHTWQAVNLHLDAFADDLAMLVNEIVTDKLDEQRFIHEKFMRNMMEENQRISKTCHDLQTTNGRLESRLEVLENAPDGGGDAILCNKLRSRVQHLVIRQHELSVALEDAAQERVKHRRDLEKTKALLADSQKVLALTRAMHDKETRQLAALVQLNHAQVLQVLQTSKNAAVNAADPRHVQQPLERFDPLSGCMIVHLAPITTPQKPQGSPSCTSPRRSSSPVLTSSPIPKQQHAPSKTPRRHLERPKSATPASSKPYAGTLARGDKTPSLSTPPAQE